MSLTSLIIIVAIACLAIWLLLRWRHRGSGIDVRGPWADDLELKRKEPYFRPDVVEAKVKSLFPNHDPAEILKTLSEGVPAYWGLERIQLGILKLSGGDLRQLHNYVEAAKRDFNSVIRSAEYPESSRVGFLNLASLPADEQKRIAGDDLRQYLAWLKRP